MEKFLKANKKLEDTVNVSFYCTYKKVLIFTIFTHFLKVFEANLSLATVSDRLNELNFGDSLKEEDFLKKETEELFAKMETSYKESFSQVYHDQKLNKNYYCS